MKKSKLLVITIIVLDVITAIGLQAETYTEWKTRQTAATQSESQSATSQPSVNIALLGGEFFDLATLREIANSDDDMKSMVETVKFPVKDGLFVRQLIEGGPADKAGIKLGDIIVSIAGVSTPTKDVLDFLDSPTQSQVILRIGTKYPVVLWRVNTNKVKGNPWNRMTIMVTAESKNKFPIYIAIKKHIEWENQQAHLDEAHRSYELKGDRLGMALEIFKYRYHRVMPDDPDPAPFCSDKNPNVDISTLFYKKEYAKAGIVNATTVFPYEIVHHTNKNPTIAGAPTSDYIYSFLDGKLYQITIFFDHNNYNQVMDALKAKYGEPKATDHRSYQNAFGVKFDGDVVLWSNAVSEISIYERAGKVDQSLLILTQKELSKTADDRIKVQHAHDL